MDTFLLNVPAVRQQATGVQKKIPLILSGILRRSI